MSQWMVFVFNAAVMIVLAEAGFRFGRRAHYDRVLEQIGGIQGAILGLLGLLLGFTFAMAINRYEQRRLLVVKESNAIGTTYLRASLLPPDRVEPVRAALRRYVDARLDARLNARDHDALIAAFRRGEEIQAEIWKHAELVAREAPNPITATFVQTLNDMIDASAERTEAAYADIPDGIWILLIIVAGCGSLVTGTHAGAKGHRTALAGWMLPLLIAVVIVLIFDISHPLQGMIGISQQPMIDLQQWMRH